MLIWVGVAILAFFVWHVVVYDVSIRRLVPRISTARRLAGEAVRQRPAGPGDTLPPAEREQIDRVLETLTAAGAQLLGNMVELKSDGVAVGVVHWFAADSGTTCGWVAMVGSGRTRRPAGYLFSESTDGHFAATRWGAGLVGNLAGPPVIHRLVVGLGMAITEAASRHNALAARMSPQPLIPVRALAAALALRDALRNVHREWRAAQPAQSLLEADVREYLPGWASVFVPGVIRRLSLDPAGPTDQTDVPTAGFPLGFRGLAALLGIVSVPIALVIVSAARRDLLPLATFRVAMGTMDSVRVEQRPGRRYRNYVPRAYYRYWVDGREYQGTRVTAADLAGRPSRAVALIAPYKPGARVQVHYDPHAPERAFLRGPTGDFWVMLGTGLAWIAFAAWTVARKWATARRHTTGES